jgi:hypothetical protein
LRTLPEQFPAVASPLLKPEVHSFHE